MTCYTRIIKNKTHQQVVAVIKKVLDDKIRPVEAAKELGLSEIEFDEVFEDYCKHENIILMSH